MQRALAERGIGLTLVYLPDVYKLANGLPADDEARLRALARERGIGFASPLADFAGRPLEELFLRPLDDHLAPDGAERVARAVAAVIPTITASASLGKHRDAARVDGGEHRVGVEARDAGRRGEVRRDRAARALALGLVEPEQLDLRERHREVGDPRARGAERGIVRERAGQRRGRRRPARARAARTRRAGSAGPRRPRAARGSAAGSRARARSRAGRRPARAARTDRPPRCGSAARRSARRSRPRAAGSAARRPGAPRARAAPAARRAARRCSRPTRRAARARSDRACGRRGPRSSPRGSHRRRA